MDWLKKIHFFNFPQVRYSLSLSDAYVSAIAEVNVAELEAYIIYS